MRQNDRCHGLYLPLAKRVRQCYYELLAMTSKPTIALGDAGVGFRGRIRELAMGTAGTGLPRAELERRLIELGFVEGADVELLHQGLFRSEEHTSELQSQSNLVCRLLLEKKKKK